MILIDTNVISETMRSAPERKVTDWLDAQAAETLYLSAVSLAELLLGVAILPEGRRKAMLAQTLVETTAQLFGPRILFFDAEAAKAYASVMSHARKKGLAIGVADGQIAAIAAAHRLMVATRDRAPFEAARVKVIDPWE